MATPNEITKALATKETQSLESVIKSSVKELARLLPSEASAERLGRIAQTCLRLTPGLNQCTPESFLGALFTAAQIGLEPVAQQAWILPFVNNRKKPDGTWHKVSEAQLIVGFRGIAALFYRHAKSANLSWGIRKERDEWQMEQGLNPILRHVPADGERGPTVGYYVVAHTKEGGGMFHYMSAAECLEHGKKHSKTFSKKDLKFYDSSPWVTSFDSMALKTVLIQLAKLLPISVELQRALQQDETSRIYKPGTKDILDVPDATTWEEPKEEAKKEPTKVTPPSDMLFDAQENLPV